MSGPAPCFQTPVWAGQVLIEDQSGLDRAFNPGAAGSTPVSITGSLHNNSPMVNNS